MTSQPAPFASLDDWFEAEVLVHEAALTQFLRRTWFNPADIPDLRQEVYIRVYESAAGGVPEAPRAFLLTTARNLIVDRIRRERVVSIDFTFDIDGHIEGQGVLVDGSSPERRVMASQELRRLAQAIDGLSSDCRAVVWLRRVEGMSQREVATHLGMNENTVASHLARGLKALAGVLLGGGNEASPRVVSKVNRNETDHG